MANQGATMRSRHAGQIVLCAIGVSLLGGCDVDGDCLALRTRLLVEVVDERDGATIEDAVLMATDG